MASNFEFLNRYWPVLYQIGSAAESYLYSDANACIFKLGMMGERIVEEIFIYDHLPLPQYDDSQAERIRILKKEGMLPENIDNILYALRKARNEAVHQGLNDINRAKHLLRMAYRLCCWFYEVYGDWGYIAPEYVEPIETEEVDWVAAIADSEASSATARTARFPEPSGRRYASLTGCSGRTTCSFMTMARNTRSALFILKFPRIIPRIRFTG